MAETNEIVEALVEKKIRECIQDQETRFDYRMEDWVKQIISEEFERQKVKLEPVVREKIKAAMSSMAFKELCKFNIDFKVEVGQ